jgi:hypothetical protein
MQFNILSDQTILQAEVRMQSRTTNRSGVVYILPTLGATSILWILCLVVLWSWRSRSQKRAKAFPNGNRGTLQSDVDEEAGVKACSGNEDGVFLDGVTIAAYRFTRFLCALALLSLEIHQAVVNRWSWPQVGLIAFYVSISVHSLF